MILFILEKFPSKSEHFISNELSGLYAAGVDLKILAMRKETSDSSLAHLPVTYLNFWGLLPFVILSLLNKKGRQKRITRISMKAWLSRLKVVALSAMIRKKFKHHSIEHIHAHFALLPTEVAQHLSKSTGIPFSFTAHAQDLYVNDSKKLHSYLKQAKFVFTCTQYGKAYLQDISPLSQHIHCIYHGISLKEWPFQPLTPINTACIKLLYVGRLVEKKGVHLLLEAVHDLTLKGKNIQCTIVGSGALAATLQLQVKKQGIAEQVQFAGYTPHDQLLPYFQSHDILVCPSVKARNNDMDGIPNVILEAMAVGLPVIASDLSGIPEIITHRATGMLFNHGDVNGIVQHIHTLVGEPRLYEQIRNAARKQLEEAFDLRQSNQKIKALLQSAIAS